MPRKDRRFTGEDILRIYCRHLSVEQKRFVELVGLFCDERSLPPTYSEFLRALVEPPISDIIGNLPYGDSVMVAIEYLIAIDEYYLEGAFDVPIVIPPVPVFPTP